MCSISGLLPIMKPNAGKAIDAVLVATDKGIEGIKVAGFEKMYKFRISLVARIAPSCTI